MPMTVFRWPRRPKARRAKFQTSWFGFVNLRFNPPTARPARKIARRSSLKSMRSLRRLVISPPGLILMVQNCLMARQPIFRSKRVLNQVKPLISRLVILPRLALALILLTFRHQQGHRLLWACLTRRFKPFRLNVLTLVRSRTGSTPPSTI